MNLIKTQLLKCCEMLKSHLEMEVDASYLEIFSGAS